MKCLLKLLKRKKKSNGTSGHQDPDFHLSAGDMPDLQSADFQLSTEQQNYLQEIYKKHSKESTWKKLIRIFITRNIS